MVQRIVGIVVVIAIGGAVVVAIASGYRGPVVVSQPIAFRHNIHIAKAELDCTSLCHAAAATNVYAGLPSKDVCYECHDPDEESPDKPELTRLAGYIDLDEDIPWKRVAVTRSDVFFSHRRHVTSGQIECARCHPDVAEAAGPLSVVSHVMRMDECISCHELEGADTDCLACHR